MAHSLWQMDRNASIARLCNLKLQIFHMLVPTTVGKCWTWWYQPIWQINHYLLIVFIHASPIVAHGHESIAVTNPNVGGEIFHRICCFEAKTGQEIWRNPSPRGDIHGLVTVHEGSVYAVKGQGWVAAYTARTNELLWERPLKLAYADGRPLAINQTPPIPTKFGLLVSDW